MRPDLRSFACVAAVVLAACDGNDAGPTNEALAQVAERLDTTDERLAGLETKMAELDERLGQIATWAEAGKAEAERRERERVEKKAELERKQAERAATPPELEPKESEDVDWLTCDTGETAGVMTCSITRSDLDDVLGNPAKLVRWARVVPSQKGGTTNGFKFYGIRPSSPLYVAGVKNGDLWTGVNGTAVTSIDKAMEVYVSIRKASTISFEFERRGSSWTLELNVTE